MIPRRCRVVVAVGAHWDELFRFERSPRTGESHPATVSETIGGCGFNLAAALARAGHEVVHAGLRGDDGRGAALAEGLAARGIVDAGLAVPGAATGRYAAFVGPDGSVAMAAAAMGVYDHAGLLADHAPFRDALDGADAIVLDANAPPEALVALASTARARLVLLATSASKVRAIGPLVPRAAVMFANEVEWDAMEGAGIAPPAVAFVTRGADGAECRRYGEVSERAPSRAAGVVDVIGAGDAFAAGAIDAWLAGSSERDAMEQGLDWAARCLSHSHALGWLDGVGEA